MIDHMNIIIHPFNHQHNNTAFQTKELPEMQEFNGCIYLFSGIDSSKHLQVQWFRKEPVNIVYIVLHVVPRFESCMDFQV